jgi:CBS domain containing-hemolysin-like protein
MFVARQSIFMLCALIFMRQNREMTETARTNQFDSYMENLERKGASQTMVYGTMFGTVAVLGLAVVGLAMVTFGKPAPQQFGMGDTQVIQVSAQPGERVPVYMMSGDVDGFRAARNASLSRQRQMLHLEDAQETKTAENTVTFGRGVVRDVVAEEVDSFLFRLELIGRIGGYVVDRANSD